MQAQKLKKALFYVAGAGEDQDPRSLIEANMNQVERKSIDWGLTCLWPMKIFPQLDHSTGSKELRWARTRSQQPRRG